MTTSAAPVAHTTRSFILGTAGHIDHGKSALVLALTGTDPDRLPEEQKRGMTIELGFAHLHIPAAGDSDDPLDVGVVDVPGHERFIRTMVSGATGIDLGMLVVALDDGVMPQTREHVEILDLLGVRAGLIALSKSDAVDAARVSEVQQQVRTIIQGTSLQDWPFVVTSARRGAGLDDVRRTIRSLTRTIGKPNAGAIFRLAIDRVFTIHGRGTVVTGSVLAGRALVGSTLQLSPSGATCRVRELQSHNAVAQNVGAGQRAALNLTGIERDQIERGMELATPGYLTPARYVDARIRVLARLDKPLSSHRRVRLSIGTTEAMAMLVVAGTDEIAPGGEALAQLRLQTPIVASHGQRFILRDETAQSTLGGGHVIRPVSRRFRPHQHDEIEALQRAGAPDAFERFDAAVRRSGFDTWSDLRISCEIGVEPATVPQLRERLRSSGRLVTLGGRTVHPATLDAIEQRSLAFLRRHHAVQPNEPGLARDRFIGWIEKRSAPGLGRAICERLESSGRIRPAGPYVAHADFRPALSPEDAALVEKLVAEICAGGFDPPAWTALKSTAGLSRQRLKVLEDLARTEPRLVSVGPQQFVSTAAMERFQATVKDLGRNGRKFKLAEVRDALSLNRRVVQGLLEHLDRVRFTKRVGDERVLL